jgi:hypothetical protein
MLKNLLQSAPKTEPLLRIYPNYITLNGVAATLLQMDEGSSLSVMQDDRDGYIYISNNPDAKVAYKVRKQGNTLFVHSSVLARKLAAQMEGMGAYRICASESTEFMNHKYYNVFAKKYGEDK